MNMWTPRPLTETEQELEAACAARCADGIENAIQCGADALSVAMRSVNAIDPTNMATINDEHYQRMVWLGYLLTPTDDADEDPLADLFDTLRRLLPGTNADGSPLSDADLLARAVDEIITLRTDAESAAWRDVATEPPPLRCNVLFANDYRIWVGEAREVTYCPSPGKDVTEIAYYEDGDFSDGVPPTAWAILPILDDE